MKKIALLFVAAFASAVALLIVPANAASERCEQLRTECKYRSAAGDAVQSGAEICREYRALCTRPAPRPITYCERLRRDCQYGSGWGEDSCGRYRAECQRRPSYCERLRRDCEVDREGGMWYSNCRKYRRQCL